MKIKDLSIIKSIKNWLFYYLLQELQEVKNLLGFHIKIYIQILKQLLNI